MESIENIGNVLPFHNVTSVWPIVCACYYFHIHRSNSRKFCQSFVLYATQVTWHIYVYWSVNFAVQILKNIASAFLVHRIYRIRDKQRIKYGFTKSKTHESNDPSDDECNNNVEMMLLELSKKIDGLSKQMSENVSTVREIDAKLTNKIDRMEIMLIEKVNAVKEEAESRLEKFSATVNLRLEDFRHKLKANDEGKFPRSVANITAREEMFRQLQSSFDSTTRTPSNTSCHRTSRKRD